MLSLQTLIWILFQMVKWVPLLWLITIAIASAQEIPVIQTYVLVPEIEDSYTIVNSFLYPSETKNNKFVAATAPDYYVNKLVKDKKEAPLQAATKEAKEKKATEDLYIEIEQKKDIPIISSSIKIPNIANYIATKEIYPSATNNPPQLTKTTDTTSNKNPPTALAPQKKPRIENINKKIEWKATDILPLLNFIVEDGVEVQLKKSEIISQTGLGQIKNQGQVERPNLQVDKKPNPMLISEVSNQISSQLPFKPSEFIKKPPQPNQKESLKKIPQEFQQLQRKKIASNHTYRNIFYIFVIFLIIILIIFLIVRYQRKKKSSIWSTISEKLDNYRYAIPVRQQEEEDKLENMKETISEQQQD